MEGRHIESEVYKGWYGPPPVLGVESTEDVSDPPPTTTTTPNIKQVHFSPTDKMPLPNTGSTTVYDKRDTATLPITTNSIDIPATVSSTIQLTAHIAQPAATLNSTVSPGRLDQQNFGSASSVSSANNALPCLRQGPHCLANNAPTMAKNALRNRAKAVKRKRLAALRSTGIHPTAEFGNSNTMATMTEQILTEDASPTLWNPTRVVLAIDDINNDKTDTFAPFLTPDPTIPVTSFLDDYIRGR